jgi:hypothetical protein
MGRYEILKGIKPRVIEPVVERDLKQGERIALVKSVPIGTTVLVMWNTENSGMG